MVASVDVSAVHVNQFDSLYVDTSGLSPLPFQIRMGD